MRHVMHEMEKESEHGNKKGLSQNEYSVHIFRFAGLLLLCIVGADAHIGP